MIERFYYAAKLSDNISETPEGFLICHNVPISRAGELVYAPKETPIQALNGKVIINRTIEDIHDKVSMASFEGKPVTINHPEDFVTPENWKELTVGFIQNVRPGEGEDADKVVCEMMITDYEAIQAVKSGKLRELSCGYEAEYIEEEIGRGRQENIRGNHVALVASGRCGSECAIFDHAPKQETEPMSTNKTLKEKVLGLFGKALDEAMPEENLDEETPAMDEGMKTMYDAIMKRMDSIEALVKGDKPQDEEIVPTEEETPATDATVEERLAVLEEVIAKLTQAPVDDEEADPTKTGDMCTDPDIIARAEILAPGIVKSKDVKVKALDAAMKTEEGKAVIETLLADKAFDSADKDLLFVGASEMLKGVRRSTLNNSRVSLDSLPGMKAGDMTPEKINQLNAERYGNKK